MSKEFEAFWEKFYSSFGMVKQEARAVWEAARKDHYRIGEEVEAKLAEGCLWEKCRVKAGPVDWSTWEPENVRRVPEWEPKEGEAVLYCNMSNHASVGRIEKSTRPFITVINDNGIVFGVECGNLKPFSSDKIGKPWDEI